MNGKIFFKPPKTKRSRRTIQLHDGTVATLLEHKAQDAKLGDLIFASEVGEPLDVTNVLARYYKPCLLAAGLAEWGKTPKGNDTIKSRFRMYDLRHTHALCYLKQMSIPKLCRSAWVTLQ